MKQIAKCLSVSVKKTKKDTQMVEHSCHSEDMIMQAGGVKQTKASNQPPAKRRSKIMNVKEQKSLLNFLDSGDDTILSVVVKDNLKQQLLYGLNEEVNWSSLL